MKIVHFSWTILTRAQRTGEAIHNRYKIVFSSLNNDIANHSNFSKLSDREKEFLSFVTTEMSYKKISEKMFCSPRTVEGYCETLCEKLNLKSRVGLALFAIKNGFI